MDWTFHGSKSRRGSKDCCCSPRRQAQPERYNITQIESFIDPEPVASNFMTAVHSALRNYASVPTSNDCFLTEVIKESDSPPKMQAAKMRGVRDLMEHGPFEFILKEDLPD